MLPLHLQPESHIPLYIQLRDQLRSLVHAGDLRAGDRIPASRELAPTLGVHRNTVANAYADLKSSISGSPMVMLPSKTPCSNFSTTMASPPRTKPSSSPRAASKLSISSP